MAYVVKPTESLIKFVRGTQEQFAQITKQNDTLYFVYDSTESTTGELWLGNKQIGDGGVDSLADLISSEVSDGDLLMYDATSEDWITVSVDDAIRTMSGATAAADGQSGLVPTPQAGDEDKFLKGDGTWADIPAGVSDIDEKSISLNDDDELEISGYSDASVGTIPQKSSNGITWVSPSVSGGLSYTKVQNLSEVTQDSTVYLVPNGNTVGNLYDEYMLIDGQAEIIGNSSQPLDLSDYVETSTLTSTVGNLTTLISGKVDSTVYTAAVGDLQTRMSSVETSLGSLEDRMTWQTIEEE